MFEKEVFWKDSFNGEAEGGLMFRSFDLNQFIKKVDPFLAKDYQKRIFAIIRREN